MNGHAELVLGHATADRLSNNLFWTFQAIRKNFEKSHWTVTRQWSEVTRPSADCQTTFFERFKQSGEILKKVTERSRDSGQRSRDRLPTVKQRFLGRSRQLGKSLKKVTEWSRASGRRSRDRLPTVKEREREREYLAGSCYLQYCVYPTIFPCVDPRSQLSVFYGNLPQEICGATSLMFIMRNLFPS